jgi:hypothetical protein
MRRLTERDSVTRLMHALGHASHDECRIYFTGGVTAVLLGWRNSTIDVDLQLVPERDEVLRAISVLKDELQINVELASPAHFIPELPGWETRSVFIASQGRISYYHYDFYAQALAKIERGHAQDQADVAMMFRERLIEPVRLRELFDAIWDKLYRYPAIDPASFRRALDGALSDQQRP